MNEELVKKGLDIVDQIIAGLKDVGPQMADLTLAAVHFQGMMLLAASVGRLSIGLVLIAVAVIAVKKILRLPKRWTQEDKDSGKCCTYDVGGRRELPDILLAVTAFLTVVNLFVFIGPAFVDLLSSEMWAAVIDPRIALALKVLAKAGI